MDKDNLINKVIFNKYRVIKKIGEGSFGKIFLCTCILTEESYALKIEPKSDGQNLLEFEACILCYLKGYGIPIAKSYGLSGNHHVLVMQLLGKSLEDLLKNNGNKFSLKTVCMIAEQMLDRVEYIHNHHIIHRDIKPDNFMIGDENRTLVYIIDFGLATKFRSSKTLEHNPMKDNKRLTGTARYASINAIIGLEQSRRDDLEALGYVLVYFLKGSLPWQGLKVNKEENRYLKIYEKKKETSPEALCEGLPEQFAEYIRYTRDLYYEEDPDYNYLRGLFKKVMEDNHFEHDFKFDWIKECEKDINSTNAPSNRNNQQQNIDSNCNIKKLDYTRKISELTIGMRQNMSNNFNQKELGNNDILQGGNMNDNIEINNLNHAKTLKTKMSGIQGRDNVPVNFVKEEEVIGENENKKKKKNSKCCFS